MRPEPLGPETPLHGEGEAAFKFLDFFTEADRELFEGRDDAVEAVLAGALRSRTFVLYGASGSGKTSLLLAGVFPELRDRGYRPVYVRVLEDPETDLTRALLETWSSDEAPPDDLHELLVKLSGEAPLVVALDQFEEFFVRFEEESERRAAFIVLLGRLLADRQVDLRVIFSLRQEWLGELDDFREVLPGLLDFEYRLRSLTAFGARQAISRQLNAAGVSYEPRLLLDLVDRLEQYHFDPTILQILCFEMYRRARADSVEDVRLTAEHLRAVGEIGVMFEDFLDQFAAALDEDAGLVARAVLDALITRKRTKRALRAAEVSSAAIAASEEESRDVLERLYRGRIVRRQERGGEPWFELIHERLVPVIAGWLDRDQLFVDFRLARDLATNPVRTDARADAVDALVGSAQLEGNIARFKDRLLLTPSQVKFLFRSSMFARNSSALQVWAERMPEDGRSVVHDALNSMNAAVRASGAWATRFLDPTPFRATLVTLAVQDESAEVRAAAAATLGAVGGKEEVTALVSTLRGATAGESEAACEALGHLYRAGHRLTGLNLMSRRRITAAATRKALASSSAEIAEERSRGSRECGSAGALWGLIVGTPMLMVSAWAEGRLSYLPELPGWRVGRDWTGSVLWTLVIVVASGWVLGRIVGAGMAHAAATRRAVRPGLGWFRIVWAGGNLWLFLALAGIGVLGAIQLLMDGESLLLAAWTPVVMVAAGMLVLLLVKSVVALMVVMGHRAATEPDPFPAMESLPFATALGLPVLVPGVAAYLWPSFMNASWHLATGILSYLVMVLVSLAVRPDKAPPPRWARLPRKAWMQGLRWTGPRAVIYLSFLATLVGVPFAVGLNTIPLALLHPAQGAGTALTGRLGRLRPDASFFRVDLGRGRLAVVRSSVDPYVDTWLRLDGERLEPWEEVMAPAGVRWLAVESDDGSDTVGSVDFIADFELRPVLGQGDTLSNWGSGFNFVEAILTDSSRRDSCLGKPSWHTEGYGGTIGGVIQGGKSAYAVEVLAMPSNYSDAATESITQGSLCAFDSAGDQIGDSAGTVPVQFTSDFPPIDTTGTPLRVGVNGDGSWSANVSLWADQTLERPGLVRQGVPIESQGVPMLFAVRVDTLAPADPFWLLAEAREWGDGARAREGLDAGDPRAEDRFRALTTLALRERSHSLANEVCWWGALEGYAAVVEPACENAVMLAPGLYWVLDSRGMVRGMLGDAQGAIEDLEAFVAGAELIQDPEVIAIRRRLVERLKAGVDPKELFDAELRALLREKG